MSNFEVKVVKVKDVIDHPNADRLSLVQIGGFSVVSAKLDDGSHRYKKDDLVVYVPENALVPEYLLKRGFWNEEKGIGYLAGPMGNRVKPIKLRGIMSEGILFPTISMHNTFGSYQGQAFELDNNVLLPVDEGTDVAEKANIVKWEPEVPTNMSGDLVGCADTVKYDIENIKKWEDVLIEDEMVYMTEKLHGTQAAFYWMPNANDEKFIEGEFFAASKGLAGKNLIFKDTEENRKSNLYVKTLLEYTERFKKLSTFFANDKKIVFFGEIFGKGVQDLNYNTQKPEFRVFDIWADGEFLNLNDLIRICDYADLEMVPIVYVGHYSKEILARETKGTTMINGAHIREGIVVKPQIERRDPGLGRVILKSISEDYLSRKGGTEYN